MSAADDDQYDWYSALVEYNKHVTTLAAGSIVIIASFIEKAFPNPVARSWAVAAVIGLMAAVTFGVLNLTAVTLLRLRRYNPWFGRIYGDEIISVSWTITAVGFVEGMLALGLFAIFNLAG